MIRRAWRWAVCELQVRKDPVGFARSLGVRVGKDCELLGTNRGTWGSEPYLITIGDRVLITADVHFITHDGAIWVYRAEHPEIDRFGPITVGNNVFIGTGTVLLPGVTIGDDAIIGASSVVNRDVPSRTVVAGVPARPICSIDDYWQKNLPQFTHIHTRPEAEKRKLLLERFGLKEASVK